MSTPLTTIKVCSGVRLDNSYKHSIYFSSLLDQKAYFETKVAQIFTAYSYCRKNWSIKLHATIAKARTWSYLFFDNPEDLKTYFYFITDVQYINDETVEVFLELDVLQTYFFETRFAPCFVERETPRSDELYEHTIDEGLDVGHLIVNKFEQIDELTDLDVMCMASVDLNDLTDSLDGNDFGKIYSGLRLYRTEASAKSIGKVLAKLSEDNKLDAIVSMWMYPADLIVSTAPGADSNDKTFWEVEDTYSFDWKASPPTDINGYTPKNKKLFCFPFNFIHVDNGVGGSADYRFERFQRYATDDIKFLVSGSVLPDGAVKLSPKYYNGAGTNHEEGLTLSGFPTCAWTGDTYKIWLAQNQNQHKTQEVGSAVAIGAGIGAIALGVITANPAIIGGGVASVTGGVSSVASHLSQKEDMKTYPPQAHGAQNASVNSANGWMTFTFYYKSVTAERAKIIDDFFTIYGYKVNQIKEPSRHNRGLFTYTKTVDCTVFGDFCQEDRQKIASCFNNGVTYWTNGDLIGEYDELNGFLD